jgi:hypothetical protein
MDRSSAIVAVIPIMIPIALVTVVALPFIAASRSGRSRAGARLACADALQRISAAARKARPPNPGMNNAVHAEYLYVACARIRYRGYVAETRRWVQAVPIVRKTAKWIYYGSDSWDRIEAVVGPGRISRDEFEAGTRHRHASAGRLFFPTREAAEAALYRGERERAESPAPQAPLIKQLRHAMADAHPDRGGTAEQFVQARLRYQMALRRARR